MANDLFNINSCRAKAIGCDLVDCLAQRQAHGCGYALSFGSGFFCQHPRKKDIVENTEKQKKTDHSKKENQD